MDARQVGVISENIIQLLELSDVSAGTPIFLGSTNISHMMNSHSADYQKYGADIPTIIAYPDYVGLNPKDNSIEYVKEYCVNNDFVKVAVRVSNNGNYFARSIYILNNNRVLNFISKNKLKKT